MNVVLDSHTTNTPIPLQDIDVDVFLQILGIEEWFNDESAKIDLTNRKISI